MQQDAEELYSSLVNTLSQTLKEVQRWCCACRLWLMMTWSCVSMVVGAGAVGAGAVGAGAVGAGAVGAGDG